MLLYFSKSLALVPALLCVLVLVALVWASVSIVLDVVVSNVLRVLLFGFVLQAFSATASVPCSPLL